MTKLFILFIFGNSIFLIFEILHFIKFAFIFSRKNKIDFKIFQFHKNFNVIKN